MATKTISLDPVTRIEGHLKITVELNDENRVVTAYASGNLYRDLENILKNRHPWDAIHITQRICGVCPVSHAIASVKAVEQAMGFTPNDQAILLRSLIQGGNYLQDHILHFYHLNLLDYVTGPRMSPWTPAYTADMRMSSSDTDRLINNYLEALKIRRQAQEMVAILAGKVPHVMSIAPGGVTVSPDATRLTQFAGYLNTVRSFINDKYLPDVELLAKVYNDYFNIGKGPGNLIAYGVFDLPGGNRLFKGGLVTGSVTGSVDIAKINEYVGYSHYASASGLNPASGETIPSPGKGTSYSWIKAPRYEGQVYETGPLARMRINGEYNGGTSVMDRIVARALETKKIATAMTYWLSQVTPKPKAYIKITSLPAPAARGVGLTEAPRGALGHFLEYANGKITRYQVVTPTCWNASPRDDNGIPGAMEQALIGTYVANPDQPVEVLRVVHSFDPCLACAVHVISPAKGIKKEFIVAGPGFTGNKK
ncbi:nickel-dependent hydrogenase large subunit [Neomoorella thermoacetica]|uniref:nickel-dependent hydrogenase large subunit n=1 Tax=Neomoorella thermoacetica TaxID=1525 RepID=UPI0008FBADF0|nr:nickel-dependent hydrogenase large subunit [Moorella thermoacetica]APC09242.1 periplasmic [NiFeSe] hydrogenase large subunit [Moorella thermoacetica]